MIIFVGGFMGSGRQTLAQALATKLGFRLLTVEDAYGYRAIVEAHKTMRPRRSPLTDEETIVLYKDLAEQIPRLVTMHGGVVVCHDFHRKAPRDALFQSVSDRGARIIWIESLGQLADVRMEKLANAKGAQFATFASMRAVMQHTFEPFDTPITKYMNNALDARAEAEFLDFYTKTFPQ